MPSAMERETCFLEQVISSNHRSCGVAWTLQQHPTQAKSELDKSDPQSVSWDEGFSASSAFKYFSGLSTI